MKHRQTAQAFAKCAAASCDPQTIAALQLIVADQLETALRIATSLALRTQESARSDERREQRSGTLSILGEQKLQLSTQDGQAVLQIVQLVQVFLRVSSSPSHMSYEQLQGVLQELGDISRRFGVNTRAAFASPSTPLSVSEEERLGRELQQRLGVAEQLHQQLEELETAGRGMDAAQLVAFHRRFVESQKQLLTMARSELVLSQQHALGKKEADRLCQALERKLSQLVAMVSSAAQQARAAFSGSEDPAALPSSLDASSMLMVAGASAFDAAAQMRQMAADKAALEKQLASAQRAVTAERNARLQAEKQLGKHEQRWKALEQKVAAKKAASNNGGNNGASAIPAAGGSVPASTSGGSGSSGASTAASTAADGLSHGTLARTNSGSASSSRSSQAAPHTLLSARPVKL